MNSRKIEKTFDFDFENKKKQLGYGFWELKNLSSTKNYGKQDLIYGFTKQLKAQCLHLNNVTSSWVVELRT